ncbi:MAG: glycoside hydrolase family 38 C-terminal domain-containing protein [Actinomycetota bacterium]
MHLTLDQRLTRLAARLQELSSWEVRAFRDLEEWSFDGTPLAPGERWPDREGVHELGHPEVEVPGEWPLDEVRLVLDLGGEALARVLYGDDEEGFGCDPWHRRFPLRQRRFAVRAEAVARLPFGVPNPDARLAEARMAWIDPPVEELTRLIALVVEAGRVLTDHEAADPLLACGERAVASLRWPSGTEQYIARNTPKKAMVDAPESAIWSLPELDPHPEGLDEECRATVVAAAARLREDLGELKERYPQQGSLLLSGHAHIDLAWLWPMDETARKAHRTYRTITGLMERYPELLFNQSTAQLYEFIENDDPELFGRIASRVAEGRWETIGGMWVEPDMNMPSGESIVRQLLYGQRYFKERFGVTHKVCWLPDCFGFSPGLPQLLRGAGIENFFTHKMNWSETNKFPHDLFWWEGIDGSRVLAHGFDNPRGGYNGLVHPEASLRTWRNYRGKHRHPESLLTIGYGDGGGGPTAEMVHRARDLEVFPVLPRLRFGRIEDFYESVRAGLDESLPVWVGELYLEIHRGTLTSQGRVKHLHRRAERELVAAEVVSSLRAIMGGPSPSSLEEPWRILLRNEFHDILPGSSIREVNEIAEQELAGVVSRARAVIDQELSELVERVVESGDRDALLVVNPDASTRPLRVELEGDLPGAQPVDDGCVITGPEPVPGLGVGVLSNFGSPPMLEATTDRLENEFLRVDLEPDGTIGGIHDKRAHRDVLAGRGNQIWAYVDKPRAWDAWDVDPDYAVTGEEVSSLESLKLVEQGPHRAAIRLERRFRNSLITQDVRLWANSARLDFRTTLQWNDRRWLLKVRWPLEVRTSTALFETAFGVVERPTYRNTSWQQAQFEVAGHRFADLSEPGYGVALLNDGKYGHHALGNELGLSLLRSPTYPDPLADEGTQTFTYALLPHQGDWLEGGVLAEAEDLNRPLLATSVRSGRDTIAAPISLGGLPVGLGALKPSEDGRGLVLRVYEPRGSRGEVALALPDGWEPAAEVDLLEEPTGGIQTTFSPFQVRSWFLERRAG